MTPATPETPAILSNRAFEVYDEKGEQAMLSFIVDNRDRNTEWEDPYKVGIFPLADGSVIETTLDKERYHNQHSWETRPKALPDSQVPPFPMKSVAALDWPNSETIRERVARKAAQEAVDELREEYEKRGLDPDDAPWVADNPDMDHLVDTAETLAAAPDLDQTIRATMEEVHSIPDDMLQFLDELESEYAQDALYTLPEKQRHDLIQAAKEKIRSGAAE